jgi:SAM-dependent methyltransferase
MTYSRVANHGAMAFDANRNKLYGKAIRKAVHPGSVVLDLGAGVGLHGLVAAAAGAARVYLVEPQPVVHAALEAAHAAGLADRVVILQDRIEDVRLPEKADLIVSVFTGNLLFSEDLLPSLFHARDAHLKPGGQLLPDRAQLWLAPLQAPHLHGKHVARWSEPIMGMDYSFARRFAANEILWLRREELAGSKRLAEGAAVVDVDLRTAVHADCLGAVTCRAEISGLCHGLLGWIGIRLLDQWLSTHPDAPEVHWSPVMLPVDPPLPVSKGEDLALTLQRPTGGDWTWSVTAQAGSRRHSSFLARMEGAKDLAKAAPASSPRLSAEGQQALEVLALMDQGLSNQAIALKLAHAGTIEERAALRKVQGLAMRYGGSS